MGLKLSYRALLAGYVAGSDEAEGAGGRRSRELESCVGDRFELGEEEQLDP